MSRKQLVLTWAAIVALCAGSWMLALWLAGRLADALTP